MQFAPLSQPVSAADLGGGYKDTPYVVVPWQGLYFGVHAGGVSSTASVTDSYDYIGDPTAKNSLSESGLIGGAQAGYNVQQGHIVFGVEGDIGYLGLSASKSATLAPSPDCTALYGAGSNLCKLNAKYSTSGGTYGDLTGRVGYAADRVLFYAKGGVAFLNADTKANYTGGNFTATPSTFNFDNNGTLVGWTIGAGAEYALSPSWSLKAEYQHFDFGTTSYSYSGCVSVGGACPGTSFTSRLSGKTDVAVTADAVSVGVNYHLNNEAGWK